MKKGGWHYCLPLLLFKIMTTYISLTNELLRRIGEVTMDSTEFELARNIQSLAKSAINSSVRELLHTAQEWPFTLTTETQTLTASTNTYSFPADTSSVDWDSFYLKKFGDTVAAKKLPIISYSSYLDTYRPIDDNAGNEASPQHIVQTQDLKFIVTPIPDAAYQIEYKYWNFPADMTAYDNVCVVPDRFSNVVIDGAMVYMMTYRSNEQSANIHKDKFEQGIKTMRRLLIDDPMHMSSTVVMSSGFNPRVF